MNGDLPFPPPSDINQTGGPCRCGNCTNSWNLNYGADGDAEISLTDGEGSYLTALLSAHDLLHLSYVCHVMAMRKS